MDQSISTVVSVGSTGAAATARFSESLGTNPRGSGYGDMVDTIGFNHLRFLLSEQGDSSRSPGAVPDLRQTFLERPNETS